MRRGLALLPLAALLAGCASATASNLLETAPQRLVVETPIAGVTGRHLVGGLITLGPGGEVPRHAHEGEEMLVVTDGSAALHLASPDGSQLRIVQLDAGHGFVIAPGTIHWAVAGPQGLRATATWVGIDGQPLRREAPLPAATEPQP